MSIISKSGAALMLRIVQKSERPVTSGRRVWQGWLAALLLPSLASAAPCKTEALCKSDCEVGDPAACVLMHVSPFLPLASEKVPAVKGDVGRCRDAPITCARYAAHLWAGVGVKADAALALKLWDEGCDSNQWVACYAHAKAVQRTDAAAAAAEYRDLCRTRGVDEVCLAGAALWTRVNAARSGVKYSIELPSIVASESEGRWFVVFESSELNYDLGVDVVGGRLVCTGPAPTKKPSKWLPTRWTDRACASIKPL